MEDQKLAKTVKLNNGYEMPLVGLGTYKLENIEENVKNSVKIGYRLVDTAKFYENEEQIGKALNELIEEKIIKRDEIFITTKLWQDDHENPVDALKTSLKKLNMDYVDLYLFHWPLGFVENGVIVKKVPIYKVWKGLEKCVNLGLTKSIGVSNFNVQLLFDLLSYCKIKPVCNQIEIHPLFSQNELVRFCKIYDIAITAYNPLLRGTCIQKYQDLFKKYDLFKNETIIELSLKYEKKPSQIVLNWHLHRQIAIIPKSSFNERQKENYNSAEFVMDIEDYIKIDNLNMNMRFNQSFGKPFSGGIEIFA